MTSAEKVDELFRALRLAAVGGDPVASQAMGTWRIVRPFAGRFLAKLGLTPELLEDAPRLDDLFGLIAGVALELRSDPRPEYAAGDPANRDVDELRQLARELLERVTRPA